jgi:hypothetical protein
MSAQVVAVQVASVILTSAGGAQLAAALVGEMPGGFVRHVHMIALDDAGCAVVLVEHARRFEEFQSDVCTWAARLGWLATLAPLHDAE